MTPHKTEQSDRWDPDTTSAQKPQPISHRLAYVLGLDSEDPPSQFDLLQAVLRFAPWDGNGLWRHRIEENMHVYTATALARLTRAVEARIIKGGTIELQSASVALAHEVVEDAALDQIGACFEDLGIAGYRVTAEGEPIARVMRDVLERRALVRLVRRILERAAEQGYLDPV